MKECSAVNCSIKEVPSGKVKAVVSQNRPFYRPSPHIIRYFSSLRYEQKMCGHNSINKSLPKKKEGNCSTYPLENVVHIFDTIPPTPMGV